MNGKSGEGSVIKLCANKKGFTLVEMVIVIVIIAILAAILVPSLLSWVDRANDTKLVSAAKTVKECVVAQIVEMYNSGDDLGANQSASTYDSDFWQKVSEAANTTVSNNSSEDGYVRFDFSSGSVSNFSYTAGDKTAYENGNGTFVVVDASDYNPQN